MAAALVTATGLSLAAAPPATAETEPLEYLGELPVPEGARNGQVVVTLDAAGRRMYTTYLSSAGPMLRTYDIAPDVPKVLADRPVEVNLGAADVSPYTGAFEPKRRRLYVLSMGQAGNSLMFVTGAEGNTMATETWDMAKILPGFFGGGMTYSAEDDRIYLVGEMSGSFFGTTGAMNTKAAGGIPTVAAIDPDDGKLLWARPVTECRFPLYTMFTGSLIARSSPRLRTPTLFIPCTPGATVVGNNLPYQPGLAAVAISPTASMEEAQHFDVRFHPISGNYFNGAVTGIAAYDHGSDRLFLQSLSSATPVAWVFDAHLDAWIGAITAPNGNNTWLGLNEKTGHYYMGGRSGLDDDGAFLLIADGRARRPQNGVVTGPRFAPMRMIVTDPETDRLFVVTQQTHPMKVLRDRTPVVSEQSAPDYDAQTDDLPDSEESFVAFTGDAGGFGARSTTVGDTASVTGTLPRVPTVIPQGSRAVSLARGPSTNVQPSGVAAAAQIGVIDTTTNQPLRENSQAPLWPYGTESCLDGGEGVDNPPEQAANGSASVTCRLSSYEGASAARASGATLNETAFGPTHFDSKVKRTIKHGMTTESTSTATGVRIMVPGGSSVEIGRVEAKAITFAHGQRGSAHATWTRTVEGIVARDATGKVLHSAEQCSTKVTHDGKKLTRWDSSVSCDTVAEAVRRALQVNVRLFFPVPDVAATPKGAYAAVGQSDADHAKETTVNEQGRLFAGDSTTRRAAPAVQLDVYHDSVERSRHIVQLAGVEATSIFTINRSLTDPDCAAGGCIPGGSETFTPTAAVPSTAAATGVAAPSDNSRLSHAVVAPAAPAATPRLRSVRQQPVGFVFARQSFGQGALMASFLLLAAAAAHSVNRRARLLNLFTGRS